MGKEELRLIFMGTPEFAVPTLKAIVDEGYMVVAVITAPDRPSGRGKKIKSSAIKQFAIRQGINLLQPENLKDEVFIQELRALKADLQVVVAFRMLPEKVWAMPPLGTFNLHASLLPQYRGAAPINHAIMNGEKNTGLTTFFIDQLIDTGKIIKQKTIRIGVDEDAGNLHNRMMIAGAKLVLETIESIQSDGVNVTPQTEMISSDKLLQPAPKITKADCKINWMDSISSIHNFVRGLSPNPTAFTHFISPAGDELLVKVFKTSIEMAAHKLRIGQLIVDEDRKIKIAVFGGYINILELQVAGKKRMSVEKFLRGTLFNNGWRVH